MMWMGEEEAKKKREKHTYNNGFNNNKYKLTITTNKSKKHFK